MGIEGWSLSDLTVGLYLIYLRQASLNLSEHVKGVEITSESIVRVKYLLWRKYLHSLYEIFFKLP